MNFDSCWFSLVLNFDEYPSQFSRYAFSASSREDLIFKLRSGDTHLRERTTKTGLRPPLTVISLVVFWTSTRELRKFRGDHFCKYQRTIKLRSGDILLQKRTTKKGLRPTITVTSSVVLCTSSSGHRDFRRSYSSEY
uniref:Uncharacterized protein n=1 Tax=Vespula pensylvanica TaxID=30213 RepID=A0A834PFD6_VESPE|nr:hypothetical protein H0235_000901 [Vespula pensylvanica]